MRMSLAPSTANLTGREGEARSKARDPCEAWDAKLRNRNGRVGRPRPVGVQGFKSPPPHQIPPSFHFPINLNKWDKIQTLL